MTSVVALTFDHRCSNCFVISQIFVINSIGESYFDIKVDLQMKIKNISRYTNRKIIFRFRLCFSLNFIIFIDQLAQMSNKTTFMLIFIYSNVINREYMAFF